MKTFYSFFLCGIFTLSFGLFVNGQTYTFSNAGATGRQGPTQGQVDANYSGTNLADAVTINSTYQGIQEWTVPASGTYRIEVWGAQGGSSDETRNGGLGAKLSGNFVLDENMVLQIVVGQEGINKE